MNRCALLTSDGLDQKIIDEDVLEKALSERGWEFEWVLWRSDNINWTNFDCAIIRTTWDYSSDPQLFLQKLANIEASGCRLFNPLEIVRWNQQKTYLKDLQEKGVSTIPTRWIKYEDVSQLDCLFKQLDSEKLVIKPQVGAGGLNTFIFTKEKTNLENTLKPLQGVDVMVQPFLENIKNQGEYSAFFFAGEFSHMVLKTPKEEEFRCQEEYGSFVRKVEASAEPLAFSKKVLSAIETKLLYARVDFINDSENRPCLIELELIEPSLYFRYDDESGKRLVQALEKMMF